MILLVCTALITVDDNPCYFIVNIFRRGESSKLLLYLYAMLCDLGGWHSHALDSVAN